MPRQFQFAAIREDNRFFALGEADEWGRGEVVFLERRERGPDLAEAAGSNRVRFTPYQKLIVLDVADDKLAELRAGLDALGLPIAGDQFYPRVRRGPGEAEDFADPLRLLARAIAFTDPVTGEARRFESQQQLPWPDP